MIRTLLAVALTVALVGVAVPAIDQGRVHQTDRIVAGELAALERAANSLVATDETAPVAHARRTVTVSVPEGSRRGADVDPLRIRGEKPWRRATVTYRVDGADRRTVSVDAPLYTPDGPVLVGDGTERLVLTLVETDGHRVVRVRLVGNRPTVYHRIRDQTDA